MMTRRNTNCKSAGSSDATGTVYQNRFAEFDISGHMLDTGFDNIKLTSKTGF